MAASGFGRRLPRGFGEERGGVIPVTAPGLGRSFLARA